MSEAHPPSNHPRLAVRSFALALALTFALVYGLLVVHAFFFGPDSLFSLFAGLYQGVEATGGGLFIAVVWGFLTGGLLGWLMAFLYNQML